MLVDAAGVVCTVVVVGASAVDVVGASVVVVAAVVSTVVAMVVVVVRVVVSADDDAVDAADDDDADVAKDVDDPIDVVGALTVLAVETVGMVRHGKLSASRLYQLHLAIQPT